MFNYNVVDVEVGFSRGTLVKSSQGIIAGDFNTTKLVFSFEEDTTDKTLEFWLINPKGDLILMSNIENNEVILAGEDSDTGELCSILTIPGLYVFQIILKDAKGESQITSVPGYLPVSVTHIDKEDAVIKAYLPLLDKAIKETNNLDIEAVKMDGIATITITHKDGSKSVVEIQDGSGEGTADHNLLLNRDMPNQHPMSAITGLNEALENKQPKGDYLTAETDPTVPDWAKAPEKPTYTAKEVGAVTKDELDNVVKGIPTKTSQLQNDSDFATNASVDGKFDVVNKDIQNLTHDKLDVKYERIDGKEVSQLEARAILENPTEYEDKFIIFMANKVSPTKAVATGFIFNDGEGNTYLSVTDNEGHYKRFNRDTFETFEIIAKDRTKETLALDDLTIDVQGQAGFINSVHNAFNRPEGTSTDGIIKVVAYNIENQLQEYTDVKNGYKYVRLVTGTANQHSFGMWQRVDIVVANAKVNDFVCVASVDSNNFVTGYKAVTIPTAEGAEF